MTFVPASIPPEVFGPVGLVIAAVMIFLSLRANRKKRLIDNIPTSKTTGVFIGLVELKGSAEAECCLQSYLAETDCVYYSWSIEEHWSRTETETYTDSDGKTKTRTVRKSGWTTVDSNTEHVLFYLLDDCGVIRVNPDKAKIQADKVFSHTCGRSDPLYYGKGPARSVMNSDHRRCFTEHAIEMHSKLYIMGRARLREDVVAPEIAYDKDADMFLISTRSEEQISSGLAIQYWLLGILGIVVAVVGAVMGAESPVADRSKDIGLFAGVAAGAAGVWILGWVAVVYNSMVALRQRVRQGWSNVDVQLKRRAELIPQLVAVVKGLRDHERKVQESLAVLRSQMAVTAPGQAGEDPRGCAKQLVAIKEAYPELKSNKAFGRLQDQLSETEQRIALARTYFNEIAAHYNIRLQIVPDRWISSLAGLEPQPFIAAKDFERAVVKVNLADTGNVDAQ